LAVSLRGPDTDGNDHDAAGDFDCIPGVGSDHHLDHSHGGRFGDCPPTALSSTAVGNENLRAVVQIRTMASAAISPDERISSDAGWEMAKAYERLRQEAKSLNERAGWGSPEEFDQELPPMIDEVASVRAMSSDELPDNAISLGRKARVLLGLLAGWAESNQEVFELEARFKADAAAKAKAAAEEAKAAAKKPPGF